MNWKAIGALAFVVLALSLAIGVSIRQQGKVSHERDTAVEALNQTVKAQERTESIQGTARAEKRSKALESSKHQESLQKAQEGAKDWSTTVTPTEVQEALKRGLEGLE